MGGRHPGQGGLASAKCEHSGAPPALVWDQAKPPGRTKLSVLPSMAVCLSGPGTGPPHGGAHVECPLHLGH